MHSHISYTNFLYVLFSPVENWFVKYDRPYFGLINFFFFSLTNTGWSQDMDVKLGWSQYRLVELDWDWQEPMWFWPISRTCVWGLSHGQDLQDFNVNSLNQWNFFFFSKSAFYLWDIVLGTRKERGEPGMDLRFHWFTSEKKRRSSFDRRGSEGREGLVFGLQDKREHPGEDIPALIRGRRTMDSCVHQEEDTPVSTWRREEYIIMRALWKARW